MYPAQFEYSKAGSVAEAIQILQGDPDAKIIAGGHSLLPLMKLRLARPSRVVDIGGIAGLRGISVERRQSSRIGALTTHYEVASVGVTFSPTAASWQRLREGSATRRCATAAPLAETLPTPIPPPTIPLC